MAKKKHTEGTPVTSLEAIMNEGTSSDTQVVTEQLPSSAEPIHPLIEEVECFYILRAELHRKLSVEIHATEHKLAELKKTAASLFPEEYGEPPQDKKAKKQKPKASSRGETTDSTNLPDQAAA